MTQYKQTLDFNPVPKAGAEPERPERGARGSVGRAAPGDLATASPRDQKWDTHRSGTQTVERLYGSAPDGEFDKLASRMFDCSSLLLFSVAPTDGKHKLYRASFCRSRTCPVCQWRKSLVNTAKLFRKLPDLRASYPTARFLFLTLTVRNCQINELRETLSAMNKGWKRLIERQEWPAIGWLRSTEVTKGKDGTAHPHFHALLMVPASYFKGGKYVTQKAWAERWQAALRADYEPMVDVRAVKPKIEGQDLHAAVLETLKYSIKPSDLSGSDPAWLFELTRQLKGLRFMASGGVLKKIMSDEASEDEMVKTSEDPAEDPVDENAPKVIYRWDRKRRKYSKPT